MLKFTAKGNDSKDLLCFGLSEKNLEKLKEGQPIVVDGAELGRSDLRVMIFYGKTERDMYQDLKASGVNIDNALINLKAMTKDGQTQ